MSALSILFAFFLDAAAAEAWSRPRLKWAYASSGLSLDWWRGGGAQGNGPGWEGKDRNYNPPQTLASLAFGGGLALSDRVGLFLALPLHHNRIEAYSDRWGTRQPALAATGMGDLEIGLPVRLGRATVQPQLWLPGLYLPGYRPFYRPEFQKAWRGLGVYRTGLGASLPWRAHAFWASGEIVWLKPGGSVTPLVEEGDWIVKAGYAWKRKLPAHLQAKAGLDAGYNALSWSGSDPQHNFALEPRLALSWFPRPGREIAVSTGATLWSWQGGERVFHSYGSRRIFFGVYGGYYR